MREQILAVGTIACLACAAGGDVIVEYDIANANAADSSIVNTAIVAGNTSASTMASNGLTNPFDFPGTFCYVWTGPGLNPAEYYEFEVTPDAGFAIDYDTFDLSVASGSGSNLNFELHASLDGFESSDILLDGAGFVADSTWHAFNDLDASSLGTQSVAVAFGLYLFSTTDDTFGFAGLGNEPVFGDEGQNFRVNGTVMPVPGPATLGIACVFALGGVVRRRRR